MLRRFRLATRLLIAGHRQHRPQLVVIGDGVLIDLPALVKGAVGERDAIVTNHKLYEGCAVVDRRLACSLGLQDEDHLVALQRHRSGEGALLLPGKRILQIIGGTQRRCRFFLFAGGLAKRLLQSAGNAGSALALG